MYLFAAQPKHQWLVHRGGAGEGRAAVVTLGGTCSLLVVQKSLSAQWPVLFVCMELMAPLMFNLISVPESV